MRRRAIVAVAILALWGAGIGVLIRQQYFQPNVERLAEAALRVTPGAVYFAVMRGARQVGFASSMIDTTATGGITVTDYFLADSGSGRFGHRVLSRTSVALSRTLQVRAFQVDVQSDGAPLHAGGRVDGDSVVVYAVSSGGSAPKDSQRVRIGGPVLLPTLLPLAVALAEEPSVGASYLLPVFDPATMEAGQTRVRVEAETTFVVNDSSVLDSTTMRWRGVTPDTLRAWRVSSTGSTGVNGWVDRQGRLVEATRMGFQLVRRPYEVAYENWRLSNADGDPFAPPPRGMQETRLRARSPRPTRGATGRAGSIPTVGDPSHRPIP